MKDSATSCTRSCMDGLPPRLLRSRCICSFLSITFQAFFFPIPEKALVESHPVSAWNGSRQLQRGRPREDWMEWTGMYLCLSLMPVLNHNSWQHKSSKCATESTATSVSATVSQSVDGWLQHVWREAAALCQLPRDLNVHLAQQQHNPGLETLLLTHL